MQTTLLGFAIGLILALLAALVGPYFVNWNDHRAFFEAEASRLVGVPVRVGGDIDAVLLPSPSITLRDIAIGSDRKASRLRARTLRIELGLGPLMRGEVRATEMRLVAPQFEIGLGADGKIDWPPLALAAETLSIDRLSIEDGRATLRDARSRTQLALSQLWFSGSVRSLTGPFQGKGEFVSGGNLYGYELSASSFGPTGQRVRLALKTDAPPLTLQVDGMVAFEGATPSFDGTLTLSRPAGAVLASGKAVAYEPWRLVSKVKAGAGSAALEDLLFQYGPDERGAALTGSGAFEFGSQPQLRVKLAARQIDLDRVLATPDAPRRLPLPALQGFGELIGGALRPSWPVSLSIGIDAMMLGGGVLQSVVCDVRSDGDRWAVDKLEFRAPGFTDVSVHGQLAVTDKGLGFAGGTNIDSNDPKNLAAWLAGRTSAAAQLKPWHASGDVTLAPDRIAVEHLRTEFGRGAIEGGLAYFWSAGSRPARLDANLRAEELDLDAAFGFGMSALSGLEIEAPREVALALEIGRARLASLEARDVAARLKFDDGGIAIERLSISDFGETSILANGRIQTKGARGGNIAFDLNARNLDGVVALAERFEPWLAEPLRRLTSREKTGQLHATVSVAGSGADRADGKLAVSGRIGPVRVNVAASAAGKSDSFVATDLYALADTDVRIESTLESDEPAPLLALVGLGRLPVAERRAARLRFSAHSPPGADYTFEAKLDADPIDAAGKGVLRVPDDQPTELDLERFAGTFGGQKVQGRLALRFGQTPRLDGAIDAETLVAGTTIAAMIGLPLHAGATGGWSHDPLAWNAAGLSGRVAFKAQRAVFAPTLVAERLQGVARFGHSELVFEDVAGTIANGAFEGRLAFENGSDGLSAHARVALTGADASTMFVNAEGPAVGGKLSMQSEVEAVGRSAAAFMGSVAGFGTVSIEQGWVTGLNPGVFDAVTRAVELGIPVDGNRIRDFVSGVLDSARVPVRRASADISISAGQARFNNVAIEASGTDVQAVGGVNLSDGTLDTLLTLTGPPSPMLPGKVQPAVLVALRGPVLAPKRTVDASLLTRWLTLLAVEQHARQVEAMEKAAREQAEREKAERERIAAEKAAAERAAAEKAVAEKAAADKAAAEKAAAEPPPTPAAPASASPALQAPALPPPINVPTAPGQRSENAISPRAGGDAPALVGAQN